MSFTFHDLVGKIRTSEQCKQPTALPPFIKHFHVSNDATGLVIHSCHVGTVRFESPLHRLRGPIKEEAGLLVTKCTMS